MKGLLLKDFYSMKSQIKSGFVTIAMLSVAFVMLAVSTVYGNFAGFLKFDNMLYITCFYPAILSYIPITSIGMDRLCKYDEFEVSFPISDKKKVLSIYIMSVINSASLVIYLIVPISCCLLAKQNIKTEMFFYFIIAMGFALMLNFFAIPVNLLGLEQKKVRMLMNGMVIMLSAVLGIIISVGGFDLNGFAVKVINFINNHLPLATLIGFFILVGLFALSYFLSLKAYRIGKGVKA